MVKPLPLALKQFSLKRYEPCAAWTPDEWLQALSARSLFRLKIFSAKEKVSADAIASNVFAALPTLRTTLEDEATARLTDPLSDLAKPQPVPHAPRALAVRDFVTSDLYFVNRSMGELDWQTSPDVVLRSLPGANPAKNPIFFAVNLCHSDELIAEEFLLWLQRARARTGVQPAIAHDAYLTEENLAAWHQRHLLAFLDVVFWARLTDTQLGNARIGELLYPYVANTEKRMEKNAKDALRLISKRNLEALTQLVMRRRAAS